MYPIIFMILLFSVIIILLPILIPQNIEHFDNDYVTIRRNNLASNYRISRNPQTCSNCNPKCSWKCKKPICNKICKPKCSKPSCFINCNELTAPSCDINCKPADCKVVCPEKVEDICEENPCRIKCKDPVCKVKCTKPKPYCKINCDKPNCGWKCKKPTNCPKPECKMVCDNNLDNLEYL